MLKKYTFCMVAVLITFMYALPVMAEGPTYPYVKVIELSPGQRIVTINGVPSKLDYPVYSKDGRTLVPFRFLGEALGAKVAWDNTNFTACLILNGSEVKVTIGSKKAFINGKESILDVPAVVMEGRTFIPLRFVSEALGASVDYDADTQIITVVAIDTADWLTFTDSDGETHHYPKGWTINENKDTSIAITSPLGTIITGQEIQTELSEVIAQEKAIHRNDGFELIKEGLVDENDSDSGYLAIFVKTDISSEANSELAGVFAFKDAAGKHYALKFKGKALNSIDFLILSKICERP